jgi:2-methylfumaryl-CoA hydratase
MIASSKKARQGNFFEDFRLGAIFEHATPRTVTTGDVALYMALTGSRFAVNCSDPFAASLGLRQAPLDDFLTFHIAFGKTVPDISLNAVANLGYASCVFGALVYPGDTIAVRSEIVGLRENSNRKTGTVYVHSRATNQRGEAIVDYFRWVMVRKRDPASECPAASVPQLGTAVAATALNAPSELNASAYDFTAAGSVERWGDYEPGERIDHGDGMTVEEAEHAMATRLYQNTARVHFDRHAEKAGRFGRRLIYGGHVISIARALSFNGLANAFRVAALNGGRHVAPCFAGDTIYAWSEILAKAELRQRSDLGALRVRTIAAKDQSCADFPDRVGKDDDGYHPSVLLDIDYWALMPR